MDFIIRGRQEGKTEDLVKWVAEAPEGVHRVIVCGGKDEATQLAEHRLGPALQLNTKAAAMSHTTYVSDLVSGSFSRSMHGRKVELAIDNIELMLYRLLSIDWSFDIAVVTATGELRS